MKKIIIALALIGMVSCNNPGPFTGYLVCREHVPTHMDNETPVKTYYDVSAPVFPNVTHSIFVPTTVPHHHTPVRVAEAWVWYIANKDEVVKKEVTAAQFNTHRCGEKVTIIR